jgi:hypothetical protein
MDPLHYLAAIGAATAGSAALSSIAFWVVGRLGTLLRAKDRVQDAVGFVPNVAVPYLFVSLIALITVSAGSASHGNRWSILYSVIGAVLLSWFLASCCIQPEERRGSGSQNLVGNTLKCFCVHVNGLPSGCMIVSKSPRVTPNISYPHVTKRSLAESHKCRIWVAAI